jgi:FlaA1/EpsC-like NDP-sugar epimerase
LRFIRTRALQLLVDGFIAAVALTLAYAMRFEGLPPRLYLKQFLLVVPYMVLLRVGMLSAFGVYRLVWRYVSLKDLPRLIQAALAGSAVAVMARYSVPAFFKAVGITLNPLFATVPLGVLAIDLVLYTMGLVAARTTWRMITERALQVSRREARPHRPKARALLIGAGSAGVMVAREVAANPETGFEIVGFLDDDEKKHGSIIQGHLVLGGTDRLAELAVETEAQLAIITVVKAPAADIRRIVRAAEDAELRVQIIPGLYEILSGRVNISKVRDVAIEDLLGRAPVQLDEEAIGAFVTGKVVLVTGAGGSIGSEICRQVARYQPKQLLLLDQAENPVYHIHRELAALPRELAMVPLIGNVTERRRMQQVFEAFTPQVVFHAAAHKHVPLMEANPGEAIRNNVQGSRVVADLAHETGAEAFVMISTDKAVNPTSVMGATKRLAEMYVQALATRSQTRFITVRFGNVLGSEGSVVPLFKEQIARGGPVTVTHPEMKRYFMTIPEASQLVLQAATMGDGSEIFILEMGEPILIDNLARDLIRLSGYRPDEDIAVEYVGMRPGEKLYEEINLSDENAAKTKHPRIWVGTNRTASYDEVVGNVESLLAGLAQQAYPQMVREQIAARVPEYSGAKAAAAPCVSEDAAVMSRREGSNAASVVQCATPPDVRTVSSSA